MFGLIIVIAIIVIVGLFWMLTYNSLVKLRNWIEEAWAQIEVQLKRRYDLIPNLVETVKGYSKHEQETLQKVIETRNQIGSPTLDVSRNEQMQANDALSGALRQVFALSESYPDLKANQQFNQLQEELVGTENKIAYSRQLYNKTVLDYNNKIQTVPSNLVASVHKFTKQNMLTTAKEEQEPIKVQF
ncbi:LemA protein [Seinonella peptonophila]|uniref:LemA protein n=1 Tax=Seinonella peptonophila TaxID=112248 RepID=A0A1M4YQ27_9BACL|nr:LemA family protein [Seinonella peptonophila]SHF07904.1 LemA protein [Seinonella peptonophila]